jgi:hypothetical protein
MKDCIKAVLIIFLFNILTGCSNKTYPTGTYQERPVNVDGDLSEWNEPLRFSSSGGQVQYNVTNDNDNIYISLETHDDATALKILRAGVNIYIDPATGQSKNICVAFPLANPSAAPEKNANAGGMKHDTKELRQVLLIQANTFSVTGFQNMENRLYDVSDKSRIKVAMKPEPNNGLGYEAAIPMQYIFGNTTVPKNAARNISVGIVINAMKSEGGNYKNSNTSSGYSGGSHGGGHGGGGRGMGGGGGGNYRGNNTNGNTESTDPGAQTPDRMALYKQDANWYKFKLAAKN